MLILTDFACFLDFISTLELLEELSCKPPKVSQNQEEKFIVYHIGDIYRFLLHPSSSQIEKIPYKI